VIRPLLATDLPRVTQIHLLAFPESALTALGCEAIRRYYEWQLRGPHDAVALGCEREGALAGFCFGGVFRGALSGFLRHNRRFLTLLVLSRPWLLANPLFRERLGRAGRLLRRAPAAPVEPVSSTQRSFGILAIATDLHHTRQGVGRELMQAAEAVARERGFAQMNLTVHPDNTAAVRFYEGLGWQRIERDGTWSGAMRLNLRTQHEADHAPVIVPIKEKVQLHDD
jgi:ribosomal protein S18 acetylase RimI-like enzyme